VRLAVIVYGIQLFLRGGGSPGRPGRQTGHAVGAGR
jgi:hypothetical protein